MDRYQKNIICSFLLLLSTSTLFGGITQFQAVVQKGGYSETTPAINTDLFWNFIRSHKYVIVKFYEEWCGPCRVLSEVVQRVEKKYPEVEVLEIPASKFPISGFVIESIPTVIYFLNASQKALYKGYVGDDIFIKRILQHFSLPARS